MRRIEWEAEGVRAAAVLRPDGQWMLLLTPDVEAWPALLAARPREASPVVAVAADDAARRTALADAGFVVTRVEQLWRLPVTRLLTPGVLRAGERSRHLLRPVTECDLDQVAALDNVVRHQIPGSTSWVNTTADLRETLEDEEFDPQLYLIAQHRSTGAYEGLIRVWWRLPRPRLGCLGVVPSRRRTSLAAVLVGAVAQTVSSRGVTEIETETDVTNRDSHRMARRHGGIEVGREVEWTWAGD